MNTWERQNLDNDVNEEDHWEEENVAVKKRRLEVEDSIVCFFTFIFINIDCIVHEEC